MQTKTVRVERAFFYAGKPTKVGDVIDLPHVFALEMIAAHKATAFDKQEKREDEPPKKGGKNVI